MLSFSVVWLGLAFLPLITAGSSTGALRFGGTSRDYIQWTEPDLSAFSSQFSVCGWIKRRFNSLLPVVLHYYPHSGAFLLGARGNHNYVVGTNIDLMNKYSSVPDEQWFHLCLTWSSSDYLSTVYLNGQQIGQKKTRERQVSGVSRGRMSIGNLATSKHPDYIFGGDLYKLNIFSTRLSLSEISRMSANICSNEEARLNRYGGLRWEDIVLKPRSGSVTEISMCDNGEPTIIQDSRSEPEVLDNILDRLQETEDELTQIKTDLNEELEVTKARLQRSEDNFERLNISLRDTQEELRIAREALAVMETAMDNIVTKLNSTEQDLAEAREDLVLSEENLQSIAESWNETLSELETAKKKEVYSRWDVLYSEMFLNKKLTKEMVQDRELESNGGLLVFSPSIAEEAQKGLRFGNTTGDHITWSDSDLTELKTQLSVCTWVRRRFNSPYPVILHYYPHTYGFLLGSRGNHNYVVGSNLNLRTEYGDIPDGEWFHVCMTWSSSDYTTTVYLNGEVAGSKLTRHWKIEGASGGKFAVGNVASSRRSNYILGGDLFKLNIFRKVLSLEEVKRMSASICSEEEIRLDAYRTFRWEDILLKPRSGSVTEIPMCIGSEGQAPAEQDQETEDDSTPQSVISDGILKRLEVSERKLAETEKQLAAVQTILAEILKKLNSTEQELADTKEDLEQSNEKLQAMTESWNETLSELETAKKKKVYSRWDVLYSEKFLNKKLTKEMVQDRELESNGGLLDLFVGMNITNDVIRYLKGRHEEDVVCL
ncbi:hypothetical protein ACHWQZ_G019569 [Mnemiopsis leidyi]